MGRNRLLRVMVVAFALVALVVAAPAVLAQEYGGSLGDLVLPGGTFEPGDSVDVSGEGFLPDSEVVFGLVSNASGDETDLGSTTADGSGLISASVNLPGDIGSGTYTLSATGVTPDGATLVLSGVFDVVSTQVEVEETTTTEATTTSEAPTTTVATTTTAADADIPEALPFEEGDDAGGSNTGWLVGGGALILLLLGGVAWWRYRMAAR